MLETQRLIDWEVLQERGLPDIEARQERFLDLANDLAELGSPPQYRTVTEDMAIFPTFGISLGGLFAWELSGRSGRRMARTMVDALPFLQNNQMTFLEGHGRVSPELWYRFQRWADHSILEDEERDEARFSVEASLRIVQRHLKNART